MSPADLDARAREIAAGLTRGTGLTPAVLRAVRDDGPVSPHTRACLVTLGLLGFDRKAKAMTRTPIWGAVAAVLAEVDRG